MSLEGQLPLLEKLQAALWPWEDLGLLTMNWGCEFVSGHAYALVVGLAASRGDCPIEIDW